MDDLIHSVKVDSELHLFIKSSIVEEKKKGNSYKSANDYLKKKLGV